MSQDSKPVKISVANNHFKAMVNHTNIYGRDKIKLLLTQKDYNLRNVTRTLSKMFCLSSFQTQTPCYSGMENGALTWY